MLTVHDINWRNKTAVLRADLNAPLTTRNGETQIADDARIAASAPTIRHILENGGGVTALSHLGRPREGKPDAALSLRPIAKALSALLNQEVRFAGGWEKAAAGEVALLENTRFNAGERANDAALARRYAALGDVFVMDAFAAAHRAEASVAALADAGLPVCAGLLVRAEVAALTRALSGLKRPLIGVFGGAKISTKLNVLRRMAVMCDTLIAGGGIANTLLLARGDNIGASLAQADMRGEAAAVLRAGGARLLLPEDVVVAAAADAPARCVDIGGVGEGDMIFDVGEKTRRRCEEVLAQAQTIIWNGPMGLFETPAFAAGTAAVGAAIARSPAFSLAGGGDTIAAARRCGALAHISYVSTAGGALLQYLAGETLPGLARLSGARAA